MSRRLAAALVAAAVLVTPELSSAATPAPQIKDAVGDAVGSQASVDIASVLFKTTGITTTRKVGKKRKTTYTPTKLVITETLAGAPSTQPGVRYRIEATIDGCGQLDIYYTNAPDGPVGNVWLDCPESDTLGEGGTLIDMVPKVAGSTLTWELPLKTLPKEARVGSVVSEFRAFTDIGDPVFALLGTGDGAGNLLIIPNDPTAGVAVADVATGTGTWKIG